MAAPAYLLSLLQRQYLILVHGFQRRYPASWLVWEPGPWRAARPSEAGAAKTHFAVPAEGPRPVGSDALCFELKDELGTRLVGRDPSSDVFINDLTLSRKHFVMSFDAGRWLLAVHEESSSVTKVAEATVEVGTPIELTSGVRVTAGSVELTFYDAAGFLKRLQLENEKAHS